MNDQKKPPVGIRFTEQSDGKKLKDWLMEPAIMHWFPMADEVEIDHAVQHWVGFSRWRCSLTATINDQPVGIATLYLQPYKKLAHQCEFGIIVAPEMRNKGIGQYLIEQLSKLAKETFKIELLHLQVYQNNPAKNLYRRMGFTEFGNQPGWIKELDGTLVGRTFMEKKL